MEIYCLTGKSGSGKSFHAMNVCAEFAIDAIIDDGLFIYRNKVAAGVSAKRAETMIGAIKTAIFSDPELCASVRRAIEEKDPDSILVLATSDKMADMILERLGLPIPPEDSPRRIKIEDITTEEERAAARVQRDQMGKHVIPVPSVQIKPTFAGYFIDPLKFFRGKKTDSSSERTVVRPTYSYLGDYLITEKVINDIVTCAAASTEALGKVVYVRHGSSPNDYEVSIIVKVKRGVPVISTAEKFQRTVKEQIEQMTAFNVSRVDVEVREISL